MAYTVSVSWKPSQKTPGHTAVSLGTRQGRSLLVPHSKFMVRFNSHENHFDEYMNPGQLTYWRNNQKDFVIHEFIAKILKLSKNENIKKAHPHLQHSVSL